MCIRDRYQHIGVLLLNGSDKLSQHTRTSDARHILQADFRCPGFNQPVGNTGIVFHLSLIHILPVSVTWNATYLPSWRYP